MSVKTGVVPEFKGEYFFLSNFFVSPFKWRGHNFFCGEQAFQWAKTLYPGPGYTRQKCADLGMRLLDTGHPRTAKRYGREVPLDVKTWDEQRVSIMRELTHAKFASGNNLVGQLLNTGAMLLVEGNDWGDTFWGRSRNESGKMVGLNTLGTILMEERGYWLYSDFKDKD